MNLFLLLIAVWVVSRALGNLAKAADAIADELENISR